jgi:hypothetical protein
MIITRTKYTELNYDYNYTIINHVTINHCVSYDVWWFRDWLGQTGAFAGW